MTSFLAAHWGTIAVVLAYLALAFVNNMPKPGAQISVYEYFYNVMQTVLNNPVVQRFEQKHSVSVTTQPGQPPVTTVTDTTAPVAPKP
jgi:hypothetical protein